MIVASHISAIRTMIKEFTDDTLYTDEFLANTLVSARNAIYNEELIKKGRNMSRFSYLSFCTPLVLDTFQDCKCVPSNLGCKVVKTKFEMPKVLIENILVVVEIPLQGVTVLVPLTDTMFAAPSIDNSQLKLNHPSHGIPGV